MALPSIDYKPQFATSVAESLVPVDEMPVSRLTLAPPFLVPGPMGTQEWVYPRQDLVIRKKADNPFGRCAYNGPLLKRSCIDGH